MSNGDHSTNILIPKFNANTGRYGFIDSNNNEIIPYIFHKIELLKDKLSDQDYSYIKDLNIYEDYYIISVKDKQLNKREKTDIFRSAILSPDATIHLCSLNLSRHGILPDYYNNLKSSAPLSDLSSDENCKLSDFKVMEDFYNNLRFFCLLPSSYFDTEDKIIDFTFEINLQFGLLLGIINKYHNVAIVKRIKSSYEICKQRSELLMQNIQANNFETCLNNI